MSELKLSKTRLRHGRYEAIVEGATGGARPEIEARHQDQLIDGIVLSEREGEGEWDLVVPVPADAVADGVQTVVIYAAGTDHKLGEVTLIAGDAAGDDLRAEVELLRAELDMLKRAFRRHCLETM